jgi:hypothetical protein
MLVLGQQQRERTLLHLGVTASKVIEALGARFGPVDGEGQVMILEVETDAGEVDDGLDAASAELVGVA